MSLPVGQNDQVLAPLQGKKEKCRSNCEDQINSVFVTSSSYPNKAVFTQRLVMESRPIDIFSELICPNQAGVLLHRPAASGQVRDAEAPSIIPQHPRSVRRARRVAPGTEALQT